MAEIQWIKLYTDFFEDRKIKQIRAMPDGNAILLIWINLLLLAGDVNDGGLIYVTEGVPYTDQALAEELRQPLMTVQVALGAFKYYNMIEETEGGLLISNWEKRQNIDRMERVREQNRIRKQNERSRKRLSERDCHALVTQCHATEEDKEEEKEKEYILNAPPQYDTEKRISNTEGAGGEKIKAGEGVNADGRCSGRIVGDCETESGREGSDFGERTETGKTQRRGAKAEIYDWHELSGDRLH